jgi:hypothetical protein
VGLRRPFLPAASWCWPQSPSALGTSPCGGEGRSNCPRSLTPVNAFLVLSTQNLTATSTIPRLKSSGMRKGIRMPHQSRPNGRGAHYHCRGEHSFPPNGKSLCPRTPPRVMLRRAAPLQHS